MILESNGIIAVLIGLLLPAVQKVIGDGSVLRGLGYGDLVPAVNQFLGAIARLFGQMGG